MVPDAVAAALRAVVTTAIWRSGSRMAVGKGIRPDWGQSGNVAQLPQLTQSWRGTDAGLSLHAMTVAANPQARTPGAFNAAASVMQQQSGVSDATTCASGYQTTQPGARSATHADCRTPDARHAANRRSVLAYPIRTSSRPSKRPSATRRQSSSGMPQHDSHERLRSPPTH